MLENVKIFEQSSICIKGENKICYIDPFHILEDYHDADFIFITHDHYDHFSLEDINKVAKENTIFILPIRLKNRLKDFPFTVYFVEPQKKYTISGLSFETVPSYNINKSYHPKSCNWVGYILTLENQKYYITGDIDNIKECSSVSCDIAFVPVGGTYTMDFEEAAEFVNTLKPHIAVPTHYGTIVGEKNCGKKFTELVEPSIKTCILL